MHPLVNLKSISKVVDYQCIQIGLPITAIECTECSFGGLTSIQTEYQPTKTFVTVMVTD